MAARWMTRSSSALNLLLPKRVLLIQARFASTALSPHNKNPEQQLLWEEIPYLQFIVGLHSFGSYSNTEIGGCPLSCIRGARRPNPGYDIRIITLRIENAPSPGAREDILDEKSFMRDFQRFWIPLLADLMSGEHHRYSLEAFQWLTVNPLVMKSAKMHDLERLYSMLISYAGSTGDLKLARTWFDDMDGIKGVKKSTLSLNALLVGFANTGDTESARAILRSMKRYKKECSPNPLTFYILIAMYVKLGDWLSVQEMIHDCEAMHFSLDVLTYTTLLNSYGKAGKLTKFEQIFESMQLKCKTKNSRYFVPDEETYTALLLGFSRLNHLEKLEPILTHMKDAKMFIQTQELAEEVASACSRTGVVKGLKKLVQCVEAAPELFPTTRFQSLVMEAYVRADELDTAEEYLGFICKQKRHCSFLEPGAIEALINAFLGRGELERVYGVYEKMKKAGFTPAASTYELVISALAGGAFCEKINRVALDMEEPGLSWPAQTLRVLLGAYEKLGNVAKVAEVSEKLRLANEAEETTFAAFC